MIGGSLMRGGEAALVDGESGRRAALASSTHTGSLDDEGRAIVEKLGGHWSARGGLCLCPAHADRSPSLSVRVGRKRLLLHCFAGCEAPDILRALASAGLLRPSVASAAMATTFASDERPLAGAAIRLWHSARLIADSDAERYLHARDVNLSSAELRFHPHTPYGRQPLTVFRPALLAAVRDESGLVGVHRTFLGPVAGQLARLERSKCGLGRFGSGAVRLGGVARRLGLAEGLESALSASILFGDPCWATLGTERFRRVVLPPQVEELVLFLDNDAGGRRAEVLARDAFAHIARISALYPDAPGDDWNDVLRARCRNRSRERRGDVMRGDPVRR